MVKYKNNLNYEYKYELCKFCYEYKYNQFNIKKITENNNS